MRRGVDVEMNAYCRRAVAEGVTLARATQGTCTAITLGPPGAEDVLREAIAWGATSGLHVCDPAFAGSDTLATARALAAVLRAAGPFDLVLLGRNSIDGETGQVGPEVAALARPPVRVGGARARGRRRLPAPRARARRRQAGGRDRAARRALGRRAAVRTMQGGPPGSGRGPGVADHAGHRPRAGRRAVGPGGQPDRGRRDATDGARPLDARARGRRGGTGAGGGARAHPARRAGRRPGAGGGAGGRAGGGAGRRAGGPADGRAAAPVEPVRPTRPPGPSPCSSSPAARR